MKPSIASRISRVQFLTISVFILVFALTSYLFTRFIESALIAQDYEEERSFFLEEYGQDRYFKHNTKSVFVEYIPSGSGITLSSESIFNNIEIGTHKQVIHNKTYFSVGSTKDEKGVFYHARDLSSLKARENQYLIIDALATLLILIIAWLISRMTSARVVQQLSLLTEKVKSTQIDQSINKIQEDLPDQETSSLASSFNTFLGELERFVVRERTMVGLASHELRTPIAVILGAVDVLQKKKITETQKNNALARIENAADEMNANVASLLRLSRKQDSTIDVSSFELQDIAHEVINDLSATSTKQVDINVSVKEHCSIESDRVLVKLLLRNLLKNSLQHSHSTTDIMFYSNRFVIQDNGKGMPNTLKTSLDNRNPEQTLSQSQGLGLYIVTLICERLGWHINLSTNEETQHCFEIRFTK